MVGSIMMLMTKRVYLRLFYNNFAPVNELKHCCELWKVIGVWVHCFTLEARKNYSA